MRLAFSFQSKYLGMSPFRCPSLFTILSFMEYEYGVYHPRGGTGAVIAAMARVARDMGARIKLGEPVEEILFEGRRAVGLRAGGDERRYDALVINADFAQTMTKLVPDRLRRRWTDRKIDGKKFSCSTFMMYLGIEGTLPDLSHHTIYLAERLPAELGRDRGRAGAGRAELLRAECLRDRPGAGAAGSLDAVCAGAGRPSHRRRGWTGRPSRRATGR